MTALPALSEGKTVGEALSFAAARLGEAGIERPQAEARLLLEAASGRGRGQIIAFPEHALTAAQSDLFNTLVSRRCAREPISRIFGSREFWSLRFQVGPATLDPRPDSETLVAAVLTRIPRSQRRACASRSWHRNRLSSSRAALGTAAGQGGRNRYRRRGPRDRSGKCGSAGSQRPGRVQTGRLGARHIRAIRRHPLQSALYPIPGDRWLGAGGVEYDPRAALDGGPDGLAAYRALLPQAARCLKPGGLLALEIGAGQGPAVRALATDAGLIDLGSAEDLAGIERCLLFNR